MVLIHVALDNPLCNKTNVLDLSVYVEYAMLDLLDYIRSTVGAVNVHKLGFLVNKRLVSEGLEHIPQRDEVRSHGNYRSALNIIVTGIKPATYGKSRYMFP